MLAPVLNNFIVNQGCNYFFKLLILFLLIFFNSKSEKARGKKIWPMGNVSSETKIMASVRAPCGKTTRSGGLVCQCFLFCAIAAFRCSICLLSLDSV